MKCTDLEKMKYIDTERICRSARNMGFNLRVRDSEICKGVMKDIYRWRVNKMIITELDYNDMWLCDIFARVASEGKQEFKKLSGIMALVDVSARIIEAEGGHVW